MMLSSLEKSSGQTSVRDTARLQLSRISWLQDELTIQALNTVKASRHGLFVLSEFATREFSDVPACFSSRRPVTELEPAEIAAWALFVASGACEALAKRSDVDLTFLENSDWKAMFEEATNGLQHAVMLVDARMGGMPIAFVNSAWEGLTGYRKSEVLGRNCRLLQGPRTERAAVEEMIHAIRSARSCHVLVTNYRSDGTHFRNGLTLHPVSGADGSLAFVIAVASDADAEVSAHMQAQRL
eukprot:2258425-Pleurochrysis_carterae.AAC.1